MVKQGLRETCQVPRRPSCIRLPEVACRVLEPSGGEASWVMSCVNGSQAQVIRGSHAQRRSGRSAENMAAAFLAASFLLALTPQFGAAIKLPSYITACSRSDPKLNECVVMNGKAALPFIINGDPKYRIPAMNPMVIPELQLWQGTSAVGLKLTWKNAQIHGLKDAEFLECDMNVTTKHTKLTYFAPSISITGTYSADGRVLILPVTGSGPSNITVKNMKISFEYDWPVSKRANGKEYIDITNHKMTLHDLGFMTAKFDNLFNGDKLLGDNMNRFINENWREISKEFGPGVADAIGEVFKLVLKNICDLVPYDIVFKP